MGEDAAQTLPSPSQCQWEGKAISSPIPALIMDQPHSLYTQLQWGSVARATGQKTHSWKGTMGTAALVASGKDP